MMEMVKNHRYREDVYENIILKRDFEVEIKERNEIKQILLYEFMRKLTFNNMSEQQILSQ